MTQFHHLAANLLQYPRRHFPRKRAIVFPETVLRTKFNVRGFETQESGGGREGEKIWDEEEIDGVCTSEGMGTEREDGADVAAGLSMGEVHLKGDADGEARRRHGLGGACLTVGD